MLIAALVVVHLNAIVFLNKGLFVATALWFRVTLCCGTFGWLIAVRWAKLRASLQSPLVSYPLRHDDTADVASRSLSTCKIGGNDTDQYVR